ncbi:hypothetical protein R0135_00545 [Congregibacter variabilis]|uniref:Helix-turn-helix domain-containing protein n=1 Tax=Congregibacter variabilis TaxID=3081200 RepID=A0ABZ0I2E2_9GAMM|nr:hypothetical protein R0135_00545 [Congregibacter sp. IMCC43200]
MQTSPDDFFADLVSYRQAAALMGMKPGSLAVAVCKGRVPLTRYRRGKETHFSKKEIAAVMQRRAIPAPLQANE